MTQPQLVRHLLENRRVVFGFIYALSRDVEVAEEVFQEVSLAVLDEASKHFEADEFLPWVRELARRRLSNYYRKRSRDSAMETVSESLADAVALAFDENEESREESARQQERLLDCVSLLPRRAREVVELRYRDRLSIEAVAAAIKWKASAVKVALSKARRALAECVQRLQLPEGTM